MKNIIDVSLAAVHTHTHTHTHTDNSSEIKILADNKIQINNIYNKSYASKNYKIAGITLIALVITIVILIILAGISIAAIKNIQIIDKAKEAKEKYKNVQVKENEILEQYSNEINVSSIKKSTRENLENTEYTLDEQIIGKWINGKNIYRKIIEINQNLPSYSSYKNIDIEYIPVDEIINIDCLYKVNNNTYTTTQNRGYTSYIKDEKNNKGTLQICQGQTGGDGAYATYCIMQYTKTND